MNPLDWYGIRRVFSCKGFEMTEKHRWAARFLAAVLTIVFAIIAPAAVADMQGIDVSSWQPSNITRLVDADLAVVKVTEGTGYVNPSWMAQAQGAEQTGKALGLYHYADGRDAYAEADFFLSKITGYVGRAVLVLDWESNGNAAWGNGSWVWRFVSRIHDRTRVWPLVYVQASAIGQIPQSVWDNCGLWVAQYANMSPTGYQSNPWNYGAYGEAMRQYTSTGRLPGYSGNLDLNVFMGERWQWDLYAAGDGAVKPSTPLPETTTGAGAETPSEGQICVTVQAGDSLSSIAANHGGTWSDWTGYSSGNPNVIHVGEVVCRATPTTQAPTTNTVTSPSGSLKVTVAAGDTISAIASRYNAFPLTAWTVPSGNINVIYPGDVVTYAGGGTASSASSIGIHVVRAGECLSGIFPSDWQRVAQLNGLSNPSLIYPGQILRY